MAPNAPATSDRVHHPEPASGLAPPRAPLAGPAGLRALSPKHLRAAYWALGREPAAAPLAHRAPHELLRPLVAVPYASVDDARQRMRATEELLREHRDRRSVFLTVYAMVTEKIARSISAGQTFADAEWAAAYTLSFAELYRSALWRYELGEVDRVPAAWRIAFDRAIGDRHLFLEDVVLGVNAHVNYDLALALHNVGLRLERDRCYRDHNAVNAVLASLIDVEQQVLSELYAPGIAEIDEALGSADEVLSMFALVGGRDHAWHVAVGLTDARTRMMRRMLRGWLGVVSGGVARMILSPALAPWAYERLLELEGSREQAFAKLATLRKHHHDEAWA